jgi:hypothetical protein
MYSSRFIRGVITLVVIALLAWSVPAETGDSFVQSDFQTESQMFPPYDPSFQPPFNHPPHDQIFQPPQNLQYESSCYGTSCRPVCGPYRTDVKSGYLYQGQRATTGYYIPSGRTYIEWILTGPSGQEVIPMSMMSAGDVSSAGMHYYGTDFDLYVYRNYNPGPYGGNANYADTGRGSNAYVGVSYPRIGSTYYAEVYAKCGSGHYTLTCRSYTCHYPVVMMNNPPVSVMMVSEDPVSPLS